MTRNIGTATAGRDLDATLANGTRSPSKKGGNAVSTSHISDPPRLALELNDSGVLEVEITGSWEPLVKASGNTTVVHGLISQVAKLGSHGNRIDPEASDFVLGFLDAMNPQDAAETLLLTQMASVHLSTMMLARRLNHVETIQQQDAAERALNKLARTYQAQMDSLKRYRTKVQQTVRVEHVNVEAGGQAIVGDVHHGGACDKT